MTPIRIEGADPRPLGAPGDWDAEKHGHCGGLFVRREIVGGIAYMRSAWEPAVVDAMLLLSGGNLILGIAGSQHPVVNLAISAPPIDATPVYAAKRTVGADGKRMARVEALYPHGGGRRCYIEMPAEEITFEAAVSEAIDACDVLARREGWHTEPEVHL